MSLGLVFGGVVCHVKPYAVCYWPYEQSVSYKQCVCHMSRVCVPYEQCGSGVTVPRGLRGETRRAPPSSTSTTATTLSTTTVTTTSTTSFQRQVD